jgi:hypothetical protein
MTGSPVTFLARERDGLRKIRVRIEPGQLWLVEVPSGIAELSPLQQQALIAANVVIYDAALRGIVGATLPIGGYAEAAATGDAAGDRVLARCLGFVRDGWSVLRLVDGGADTAIRGQRLRLLCERLLDAGAASDLPIALWTDAGGESDDFRGARLGDFAATKTSQDPDNPAIVAIHGIASATPIFHQVAANGLAG